MTAQRDLKRYVRERQTKTGESYTAARRHVLQDQARLLGADTVPAEALPMRAEAVVLKVNRRSARVRILGEDGQVTFRSPDVHLVVPGHLVTLRIDKRWPWKDHEYASGQIENPRIAVDRIGLEPLPLLGGEMLDLREHYEPFRPPEPYADLWLRLTARPRPDFEMDPIAWGVFPGVEYDDNPTCDASELIEAGREDEGHELLMDTACRDLRCIDAHALLGNLEFDERPERAILHYEVGMRIGELSLPAGFDGLLIWGHIHNRPFLRCLHGYGLCLWRLGRAREALAVFERMLSLNPNDNQGMRACQQAIQRGLPWESLGDGEELYH